MKYKYEAQDNKVICRPQLEDGKIAMAFTLLEIDENVVGTYDIAEELALLLNQRWSEE